ncbi:MAG: hypothetical protein JWM68_3986 [Verrucomicrobiales bacterium]|nr:hypothetical protein [Verrucomicrobiales bacterium]
MNTKTILIGSLICNLGLAGAAFCIFKKPQAAALSPGPSSGKESAASNDKGLAASIPVREFSSTNTDSSEEFAWQKLQAKDFRTYIDNLRTVDCPEETIRDVITAEVNKLYAKRLRNIHQSSQTEHKYWQSGRNNPFDAKKYYEQQKQVRAIEKEKSALLVQLLGVDPNEELKKENSQVDYWERNLQFLSEEKREQVTEIQMKFTQKEQEIYGNGGMIDDEDQKKIRELYKERLAELATVLTPGELAEYDIRASQVSMQLRHDLEYFNPNEDEFRKIFAIRKERQEDLAYSYDPDDKTGQKRREMAVKQTDEQIKALLGDDRFNLYKRAPDWNYRELVKLVDRQELPRENVDKVYDMKKETEDTANKLRTNSEYTQAQKTEMLKKMRADAEKAITDALGEKGWKKYNERQGWWLNSIAPQERKTP